MAIKRAFGLRGVIIVGRRGLLFRERVQGAGLATLAATAGAAKFGLRAAEFSPNVRTMPTEQVLHIIGGGLAGSEAAWQAAAPACGGAARDAAAAQHRGAPEDGLAELVCSNSFRSDDADNNAVGSAARGDAPRRLLSCARRTRIACRRRRARGRPRRFSAAVTRRCAEPDVRLAREEVAGLPPPTGTASIVATGPLTSPRWPRRSRADRRGVAGLLRRHRAHRPCRDASTWTIAWLPVALRQEGRAATAPTTSTARSTRSSTRPSSPRCSPAEKTEFKEWEKATPYFEGCLPIEVMAARGPIPCASGR